MKRRPSSLVFECDRGPWPFNHPAAQRPEQALDSSPLKGKRLLCFLAMWQLLDNYCFSILDEE